jgi:hypothetical protein
MLGVYRVSVFEIYYINIMKNICMINHKICRKMLERPFKKEVL